MTARPPRSHCPLRVLVLSVLAASACVLACIAGARPFDAQSPPVTTNAASSPAGASAEYIANFAALQMRLQQLDDGNAACEMSSLAQSGQGRDVFLLTLAADASKADSNPAVLVVAGLDGRHRVGVETALRLAARLLTEHAESLANVTYYIVPCANPDGFQFNSGKVDSGHVGNLRAVDSDRDGVADEDGPADINGDGVITMMRRIEPPLDDWGPATHVADPAEPRLLKPADAVKGERAIYSVHVEGLDADGDGAIAEDGPGLVDLDRNFMHRYPEHDTDAGIMPVSEPEALALADFVIRRRNIMAAIVYGRHDNMINVPDGRGTDISGEAPRDLDAGDVEYYKAIARKYKELTGQSRAASADTAGSFQAWVYAQRGIPTFASNVWGRPEIKDAEKPAEGEAGREAKPRDAVSGEWSGTVMLGDAGEIPFTFTLALGADNAITGTVDAAGQSGKVAGTFDPESAGTKLTADYGEGEGATIEAAFKDDVMNGAHHSPDGEVIQFTAKRAAIASQPTTAPLPAVQEPENPRATGRRQSGRRGPPREDGAASTGDGPGSDREGGGRGGDDENKPADAEAAAWLKYSDAERNKEGFIGWQPFDHPALGRVEIGGFAPGFQMNPPAAELDELAAKQTAFANYIAAQHPRLSVQGPQVTKLADGLYEVRLGIVNDGYLPTATAMARKARSIFPSVVRISTPIENIVSGERTIKTYGISGSGDRITYRWIVRADNGSDVTIEITNPHMGDRNVTFKAEE